MYPDNSKTYTASGNGVLNVAVREAGVISQLGMQEKLATELFEYTKKLEATLAPILRAPGPDVQVNPTPQQPLVPLAAKIQDNNERISAALATVNSILQRLEL